MSSLADTIIIAIGSAGAFTTLAGILRAWLSSRRTHAKIRIQSGDRTLVLDAENITIEDLTRILQDISKDIQGDMTINIERGSMTGDPGTETIDDPTKET
jgi:hypothetical protein